MVRVVENEVVVPADAPAVWARVVHPDGFNHEMRPWITMTMPRGAAGLTVVELEPGRRFLERSTMLSMRRWEHERRLTPVEGGTRQRRLRAYFAARCAPD